MSPSDAYLALGAIPLSHGDVVWLWILLPVAAFGFAWVIGEIANDVTDERGARRRRHAGPGGRKRRGQPGPRPWQEA